MTSKAILKDLMTHDPNTGTYGVRCPEHNLERTGLVQRHAMNLEAKHLREDHAGEVGTVLANLSIDVYAIALRAAAGYVIDDTVAQLHADDRACPECGADVTDSGGRTEIRCINAACRYTGPGVEAAWTPVNRHPMVELWETITGLAPSLAREVAQYVVAETDGVVAQVVPF